MRKKIVVASALSALTICICIPLSIYESKVSPEFRDQVKLLNATFEAESEWGDAMVRRGNLNVQIMEAKTREIEASLAIDTARANGKPVSDEDLLRAQRIRQGLETARDIEDTLDRVTHRISAPKPSSDEISKNLHLHARTIRDRIILYHVEAAKREALAGSQCLDSIAPKADREPCLSHYRKGGNHQKIIDRAIGEESK